jgi:hypothetical protein
MEDDLNKNKKWKTTSKKNEKWKMTSKKIKNQDDIKNTFLYSSLIKGQTFPGIGSAL